MAQIGEATVEVGDWLRDVADDREGCVTAVEGDDVTLQMLDRSERTRPVGDLRYNGWDAKAQPDLDSAGAILTRRVEEEQAAAQ